MVKWSLLVVHYYSHNLDEGRNTKAEEKGEEKQNNQLMRALSIRPVA